MPTAGEVFTIIDNETGGAVSGDVQRPGARRRLLFRSGAAWQISYDGGANNHSVTLTALPTSFTNVSSAADLSADINTIDLESQASGGNGTNYSITLGSGLTLTEAASFTPSIWLAMTR